MFGSVELRGQVLSLTNGGYSSISYLTWNSGPKYLSSAWDSYLEAFFLKVVLNSRRTVVPNNDIKMPLRDGQNKQAFRLLRKKERAVLRSPAA